MHLDVLRVELNLLREGVGEGAHGPLGGRVTGVARDAVKGDRAAREDEMLGLLLDGRVGREPCAENGVRHVGGAVEVDVHLTAD